jgi:hypothetical protein
VGDDPAPAGGKPPRARGIPESGGKIVGASDGATPLGALEAAVPDAADAPLAGTPMSGGIEAGDGAEACDGDGELDKPGAAADAGRAADADADAEADADAASGGATELTGGA